MAQPKTPILLRMKSAVTNDAGTELFKPGGVGMLCWTLLGDADALPVDYVCESLSLS